MFSLSLPFDRMGEGLFIPARRVDKPRQMCYNGHIKHKEECHATIDDTTAAV